jgi:hypothetical protein
VAYSTKPSEFAGHFDDVGKLHLKHRAKFDALGKKLAGVVVTVTVEPEPVKASDKQRKFYFGQIITPLAEELGYDADEIGSDEGAIDPQAFKESLHYAMLREFGGVKVVDGIEIPVYSSWKQFKMRKAWEYMEFSARFAAKHGVMIYFPSELREAALQAIQDEEDNQRRGK